MDAKTGPRARVQALDLHRVAQLWRQLGHTPGSIGVYRRCIERILQSVHTSDYRQISGERVSRLARLHACKHHVDLRRTEQQWLSAFRAFVWGLQRLGKAAGPTVLAKRRPNKVNATIAAFQRYGRSLGWAENTLHIHVRYLGELRGVSAIY